MSCHIQKISILSFFLTVASGLFALEKAESFEKQITVTVKTRYIAIMPDDLKQDEKYPLLLFLHGSGERGNNLENIKKHGPFSKIQELKLPFIIIAPQCPSYRWWDTDMLNLLLDEIMAKYPVDPERIYLTGLSMGGFAVWNMAIENPERFAGIVPICGGGETALVTEKMKNLPIWAFHGAKDTTVQPKKSQEMVDAINKIGGKAKLTIYPEAAHDSWTQTYNNPELYQWLLSHKRCKKISTH